MDGQSKNRFVLSIVSLMFFNRESALSSFYGGFPRNRSSAYCRCSVNDKKWHQWFIHVLCSSLDMAGIFVIKLKSFFLFVSALLVFRFCPISCLVFIEFLAFYFKKKNNREAAGTKNVKNSIHLSPKKGRLP